MGAINPWSRSAIILALIMHSSVYCHAGPVHVPRQIRAVRFWTAPDHTRVVLDISSESEYKVRVLTNPHRIAIDVTRGRFSTDVEPVTVGDGVIERIRINRLRSSAQVVLDLPRKTKFRDFALKPFKGRPHRIVIDLERVLTSAEIKQQKEQARRIASSGDFVVIIDPGHGGSQPGACSRYGPKEKTVVLSLARMMAAEINKKEGFRAVLTRDGDYDVGLQRRIDVARSHGGDCFVSVHMNSSCNSKPRGSEVYFLSLEGASDENAQAVAERENLFLQMGERSDEINDDLKSILFDLNRRNSMYRSSQLAGEIASSLRKDVILPFRGVKQANFVVLRSISMPSVLVEAAFLSNKKDVRLIKSKKVLQGLAASLARGITAYLGKHAVSQQQVKAENVITHVVVRGETLWRIAKKYGITVAELRARNGLAKNSQIHPGQKLLVAR